eukprot:CAMPEP_0203884918 /NCGR_PEP_ID=MMETSP0359-20131031/28923_1 /ASSEMBLY_ACC=CAM_ASM_000338 /TAXON_ID=268821 /ORGANISM="Scrippsiella Hangoei, Strain SHTV-5" /LENGTH=356 /DNA_ID=CAMNT_0050805455 /DNA_START=19 /DNA_END=1086 /DNA_ORIENTATION=-
MNDRAAWNLLEVSWHEWEVVHAARGTRDRRFRVRVVALAATAAVASWGAWGFSFPLAICRPSACSSVSSSTVVSPLGARRGASISAAGGSCADVVPLVGGYLRRGASQRCSWVVARAKAGTGKDKGKGGSKSNPGQPHMGLAAPSHPLENVFCFDVECVATGTSHLKSDREPCSMALVDGFGETVLYTLIRPTRPVASYLTPFTGLKEGDLEGSSAIDMARAIRELKECLSPKAVIVGQNPEGDAEWMQLKEGEDFESMIDLAEVFANTKGMRFSLRHEALVLLGREAAEGVHDPCWDALASVDLYKLASEASPKDLEKMRDKMTHKDYWPPKDSLARQCGYNVDGICLSMYNKDW